MKDTEILKIFKDTGALLKGHFKLSSGLHSEDYLQCALVLQYPEYAEKLCSQLAGYFKDDKPTCVVAPALGGVVVSYAVARALGARSLFTERKDVSMVLRRGFQINKNDRVVVVEDVITTGLSTKEVLEVVKAAGAAIVGVGSIIDRSGKNIDFGVKSNSLLKLDLPAFPPEKCPLCKQGIDITKPGSR
ncbi:MAG: orotate phosphoribosyltransferase [Candidatus Omnitrophica bacterium]|nr:orotate phosphoribosyltransferase [Candidatus Omnitrophota bacterium]MBU4457460.1 orotate phosphoribosyltransferase [Candidatus Omnitrophota bacterium]